MKKLFCLLLSVLLLCACGDPFEVEKRSIPAVSASGGVIPSDDPLHIYAAASPQAIVPFEDPALREAVVQLHADRDGDGQISFYEAALVDQLPLADLGISSLGGLRYFTGLVRLNADYNDISDLSELAGLQILRSVSIVGNRVACSAPSGIDPAAVALLAGLRARGVDVRGANTQQVIPDTDRADTGSDVYRVLIVAVREMSMRAPNGKKAVGSMNDDELEAVRLLTRSFEQLAEKMLDYRVDIQTEVYVTRKPVTGVAELVTFAENPDGDVSLDALDIAEVREKAADFDAAVVFLNLNEELHTAAGFGCFDEKNGIGLATVYLDSCLKAYLTSSADDADFVSLPLALERLKRGIPENGVYYLLHEFTHTVEDYALALGFSPDAYHDVLQRGNDNEQYNTCADYLANTSGNGIPAEVWQRPPRTQH